jgi:hypothetical protein
MSSDAAPAHHRRRHLPAYGRLPVLTIRRDPPFSAGPYATLWPDYHPVYPMG